MIGDFLISPSRISAAYGSCGMSAKPDGLPTKESHDGLRFGEGTGSLRFVPHTTTMDFLFIPVGNEMGVVDGYLYCVVRRMVSTT